LTEDRIIIKERVGDNFIILKHFIAVSLLPTGYPVKDETGKNGGEFLTVIFPVSVKQEGLLFSFTGNHYFQM